MFRVLLFRVTVIVAPAAASGGHGLPAPASACTLPSGQNSSVGNAVNVACGCRRRSAPSLFGRVSRLASAPVGRYG